MFIWHVLNIWAPLHCSCRGGSISSHICYYEGERNKNTAGFDSIQFEDLIKLSQSTNIIDNMNKIILKKIPVIYGPKFKKNNYRAFTLTTAGKCKRAFNRMQF